MSMQKRVGFVLTIAQVQQACEAFVAPRLLADEEASAVVQADIDGTVICRIDVSKKRKPRTRKPRGNGVASAGPLSDAEERFA